MCKPQWYASFCIYAITIHARRAGYIISGTNEWRTKTYKSFLSLKNKKSKNAQESTDLSMPIEPHTHKHTPLIYPKICAKLDAKQF